MKTSSHSKRRILHVVTSLQTMGGCERMLLSVVPKLSETENLVVTLWSEGRVSKLLNQEGVRTISLGAKSTADLFRPRIIRHFQKILVEYHPDTVVTYLLHANIFGTVWAALFSKARIVNSLRYTPQTRRYLFPLIIEFLLQFIVDAYIANSQSIVEAYHSKLHIPRKKFRVIHNGINLEHFAPLPTLSREQEKRELRILPGVKILTCVAKLRIEQKGHFYLLEAMRKMRETRKDFVLLLVGDGPDRHKVQEMIKNYELEEAVILLGDRSDVPSILSITDIFVLPTLYEGMSNALLEAMAVGLPIVTTNISENKELIEHNKSGILVPVRNSQAIGEALQTLLSKPDFAKRLGGNARKKAEMKFNLDRTITSTDQFFGSFIANDE